ncbi:electron transport complex subunit RsxB [Limnohabitans sp. Jir72]|uniref:electron transport complex subunit RsxB n=1 Tax=Limnohabitans sp. Jir72 TaxID=1977909 RepID=UPI000D367D51|nr:electron transport complex subunit RsxB [Limnohabitans sp. Jir72]PUE28015.1 ferredoxin [Limnohabitans sp. Jir72]
MPGSQETAPEIQALFQCLNDALPQTQCTRCGFPDCASYAMAMAQGQAAINQCPPGGQAGIERLAQLTGQPVVPLNPEHGTESPRQMAIIDEAWCIGCTLCIKACPTDAILGANKLMHTVIEPWCTGCELCIPVCPVDCIQLDNVTGEKTGWAAWSTEQADTARQRYASRQQRLVHEEQAHQKQLQAKAEHKLADLAAHTKGTEDAPEVDRKRAIIEAALAKAKARQTGV